MLQSEFNRINDRPFTEEEFSTIHYVYCYHPAANTHAAIALLWTLGGIRLIRDMLPTAKKLEGIKENMKVEQEKLNALKARYEAICSGVIG